MHGYGYFGGDDGMVTGTLKRGEMSFRNEYHSLNPEFHSNVIILVKFNPIS